MDIAVSADHKGKLKESENRDTFLDLVWELKNYGTIPNVIGTLDTVKKGLVRGLEDLEIRERVETIQTTV